MNEPRRPNWGAEALWQQLQPLLPGISVEVVARCDSTSTRLLERIRTLGAGQRHSDEAGDATGATAARAGGSGSASGSSGAGRRAGDTQPALLVAEHQTAGRGRMGRDWHGAAGQSLTFSLALALAPQDWSGLSLAVGLALAEALDPPTSPGGGIRLALKWPNDLWLVDAQAERGGRKLGGVLIETVMTGTAGTVGTTASPGATGNTRMVVVGVGLNLLPQTLGGLSSGYACLQELDAAVSAPAVLHRVAAPLVQALQRFEAQGFAPCRAAYEARDLLRGRAVSTTLADLPTGIALGVDAQGALRLARPDGSEQRVLSGEVSVRPEADALNGTH